MILDLKITVRQAHKFTMHCPIEEGLFPQQAESKPKHFKTYKGMNLFLVHLFLFLNFPQHTCLNLLTYPQSKPCFHRKIFSTWSSVAMPISHPIMWLSIAGQAYGNNIYIYVYVYIRAHILYIILINWINKEVPLAL